MGVVTAVVVDDIANVFCNHKILNEGLLQCLFGL